MSDIDDEMDAKDKALEGIDRELTLEELAEVLGTTIKHDRKNKVLSFIIMVGNYLGDDQSNIMFRSESSTGKSYLPLELKEYFPPEDVEVSGYVSPTAFFHDFAVYDKATHTYRLDMSKKIYIMTDQPSTALLIKLRSLLSHDQKELQMKITDKSQKSGFRTRNIFIIGFPTFIMCTASGNVNLQESTRFFQISPDVDAGKIADAIRLLAEREGHKKLFERNLRENISRIQLQNRITDVKASGIKDVVINDADKIAEEFIKKRRLNPRHMRDFPRLLRLIKYWALLNHHVRKRDGDVLYAETIDKEIAFILYDKICEANELGISPESHEIYKKVFENYDDKREGLTKQDIYSAFYKEYGRRLGAVRLEKEILPDLMSSGLIYIDENTGKGGKAKVYRLQRDLDSETETQTIEVQSSLFKNGKQLNVQDKLNLVYNLFMFNTISLTLDEIIKQTDGKLQPDEVGKIIQILINDNKIYQPEDYKFKRVG